MEHFQFAMLVYQRVIYWWETTTDRNGDGSHEIRRDQQPRRGERFPAPDTDSVPPDTDEAP